MAGEQMVGGYLLLKHMTTGQTSQVYEATEPGSGRHFALKMLLPEFVNDLAHRKFLTHEANVGMALSHPNVIRILKFASDKNLQYLVMEFFPGGNLKFRIMKKHTIVTEKAHSILVQAAQGFAHLNDKGWVHRDVKPDNILLNSSGEVRVIDFALASRVGKATRKSGGFFSKIFGRGKVGGTTSGTRSYMSPEQILSQKLDARADVYSFGATAYELVTGRPPFRGASPNDLLAKHLKEKPMSPVNYNPELTEDFCNLVLRCLAKNQKERFNTFHELLSQLRTTKVFKSDKLEAPPMR